MLRNLIEVRNLSRKKSKLKGTAIVSFELTIFESACKRIVYKPYYHSVCSKNLNTISRPNQQRVSLIV